MNAMMGQPDMTAKLNDEGPTKPDTVEELSQLMREKMCLTKDLHMTNRHIGELRNQGEAIKARLVEVEKGIQKQAELFDRETNWQ